MHRKTDQSKPKFSTASNVLFMLRAAWRVRRSVLWLCLAQIGLGLANSLLGLFAAPQVLFAIEQAVPLGQLLATIGLFTLGLTLVSAATAYIGDNVIYDRIAVRTDLLSQVNGKLCQTAYTNTLQPAFLALLKKSQKALNNNDSAGEIIWETLQTLALNVLGFILYLVAGSSRHTYYAGLFHSRLWGKPAHQRLGIPPPRAGGRLLAAVFPYCQPFSGYPRC